MSIDFTTMEPQSRLLEDSALPTEIQCDLNAFASPKIVNYDAAAGLARFEAAIGMAPVAAAGAAEAGGWGLQAGGANNGIFSAAGHGTSNSAAALGLSSSSAAAVGSSGAAASTGLLAQLYALKIAGALALGTMVVGTGYWLATSNPALQAPWRDGGSDIAQNIAREHPQAGEPGSLPGADQAGTDTLKAASPAADAPQAQPAPQSDLRLQRQPRKNARHKTGAPDPGREAIAVNRARKALARGQARRTLSILSRLKSLYPQGHLIPERKALRALALYELGREKQAEKEAKRFLGQYPNSPLAPRLRALLGKSGSP